MTMMTRRMLGASAFALLFAASFAVAQQPQTIRTHGTIESVNGSTFVLKPDQGANLTVKVTDNAQIFGVQPATIADVKPGAYIAVNAAPQPDGVKKQSQSQSLRRPCGASAKGPGRGILRAPP